MLPYASETALLDEFGFTDAIGLVGALMLCAAYFGVSRGWFDARRLPYQLVNLGGSSLLLVSLYFKPNPGAILIEVLWAAIAITAIIGIVRRRQP